MQAFPQQKTGKKRFVTYIIPMEMIREVTVTSADTLEIEGKTYVCRTGRGGFAAEKREGDLKTPKGSFAMRCCYFRPDRIAPPPATGLKLIPLSRADGWCDDPADPLYNRFVKLPIKASHEKLWREDNVYDLIIPLGYNDETIVPGHGSAIFMHLLRGDGVGTEGCVALERWALLSLLPRLNAETRVVIPMNLPAR